MTNLRSEMADAPQAMRSRPVDHRGFYVPWFVTDKDDQGRWNFQHIRPERRMQAIRSRLDWVTGEPLGRHAAFCIGPMCIINRVTAEPPVRLQTARWSARVCPFMARPLARHSPRPEWSVTPGIPSDANPGIVAIYSTTDYRLRSDGLIHLGEPSLIEWWAEGRLATPAEIHERFGAGASKLGEIAAQEGNEAVAEFGAMLNAARDTIKTKTFPAPVESRGGVA